MTATDRAADLDAFLDAAGWADATRAPLAGDASLRRYVRLHGDRGPAIAMDAPPGTGEDVRPFVRLARHLADAGLSAPAILAADEDRGFLLLEDLGDDLLARVADRDPAAEPDLYAAAARTLAAMQAAPAPGLPDYLPQMAPLAATITDWYAPELAAMRDDVEGAMAEAVADTLADGAVMVHRDYHAENLLWLPGRDGAAAIGLLDFQDAMTGPAEYDLASLIHDPRRTVAPNAAEAALAAWLAATGTDPDAARARIAVASVQRSMRILGRVFTRLCLHSGRDGYLRFVPRTWEALMREVRHPALARLAPLVARLPAPDAARIAAIRAHAGRFDGRDRAEPYA